jgi:hypothetical protein
MLKLRGRWERRAPARHLEAVRRAEQALGIWKRPEEPSRRSAFPDGSWAVGSDEQLPTEAEAAHGASKAIIFEEKIARLFASRRDTEDAQAATLGTVTIISRIHADARL